MLLLHILTLKIMFKCVQHSNKTKTRQNSPITEYISVSMIGNDNRTKWSPIRSVIILVTDKIRLLRSGSPIVQPREWLQTELDDKKSSYKFIITVSTSENNKYI